MANDSQLIASFFKKIIKWFLYFLLLVITILALAYWSAPYWVPSQVQKFLPNEFKVNHLNLERPGLNSAFVKQLELDISLNSKLKVRLDNIELNYSLLQKNLTGIKAEKAYLLFDSSDTAQKNDFSNRITIPDIPVKSIEIEQLTVSGVFIQDLDFENFTFKNSDANLHLNTQLTFIGLNFSIDSQLYSKDQMLHEFNATVLQGTDNIKLSVRPQLKSSSAFTWSIDSLIETSNYYPIDGLSSLEILGSGVFDYSDTYKLQLNKDFSIKAPIDLTELNVKSTVKNLLDDKGLTIDLTKISESLLINLQSLQESQLTADPQSYLTNLSKGSLQFSLSHPVTEQQIIINQLKLDPNLALSDPFQLIAGDIQSKIELQNLHYNQDHLKFNSEQLTVAFAAPFIISNSNLELLAHKLDLNLGGTQFKDASIRVQLPATQWQGSATIFQNLLGDDRANSKIIALSQSKPLDISFSIADEVITLRKLDNRLQWKGQVISVDSSADSLNLSLQTLSVSNLKTKTKLDLTNNRAGGTVNFDGASFANEQVAINPFSGNVNWSKVSNEITAKGTINYLTSDLPFNYRINLKNDKHNLSISPLHLNALDTSHWLSPILQNYPSLTIEQGDITSPKLSGNPVNLAFDGKVQLRNLDLSYDKLKVINLQLNDQLNSKAALTGTTAGSIGKIEVATGIDISDLQFFLIHGIDNFNFSDIYGRLLKGSLYIPQLTINPEGIEPFTANLTKIDFGQLLEALDAQSLTIAGLFDFSLPTSITADSQTITNGHFNNVGSGILQVDSGETAETNIAFQALQNFHYQEFSGTIDYSDKGIYHLDLLLKGANPDLYDGFPIELKMKVEGNLPNLLYSMLISGDMAKPIIDKYQSGEFDLPIQQQH